MPKFSIIIPAYNVADYISDAARSVLDQDFSDFEIILIDDGSTDDTAKLCRRLAKADQRIRYLHQSNSGLSATRNRGIAAARGEYFLLLDGDDMLAPHALSRIDAALTDQPDLLRFQVQDLYADGSTQSYPERPFDALSGGAAFPILASYHYTENAWAYAYRTAFFEDNHFQYTPGCLAEDFGLTPLIIAKSTLVKSIPDVCYIYRRQRADSIMNDATKLHRRVADSLTQVQQVMPIIATLPGGANINHYLIVSFLTLAARLPYRDFLTFYRRAQRAGLLHFIHPTSPKSWPRSFTARFAPALFYKFFHSTVL